MLAFYVLIAVVAARPTLPKDLGFDVSGLAVEGAIVTAFIFLGVNLAWGYFMRPLSESLE